MKIATTLLATPQTDRKLRREQNAAGRQARIDGKPRSSCPHDPNSLVAEFWFEGYDAAP